MHKGTMRGPLHVTMRRGWSGKMGYHFDVTDYFQGYLGF